MTRVVIVLAEKNECNITHAHVKRMNNGRAYVRACAESVILCFFDRTRQR
jgi:hypothetical protein